MKLEKIKSMNCVMDNIHNIQGFFSSKEFKERNWECVEEKIILFRDTVSHRIKEVEKFAEQLKVYIRISDESTATQISSECFGFWLYDTKTMWLESRKESWKFDKHVFIRMIERSMDHVIPKFEHIKIAKNGNVTISEYLKYDFRDYEKLREFKNGDFVVKMDGEIQYILDTIKEFRSLIETLKNN